MEWKTGLALMTSSLQGLHAGWPWADCTRVICDDLNPVWRENCALLVTLELIKADEQLSVELWDSDRTLLFKLARKSWRKMQAT